MIYFTILLQTRRYILKYVAIIAIINTMQLPAHDMGTLFAKYHYLLEQYTRFKAIAERTAIANRYSYFYTMIQSERDKQRAGDTE